jgi:sigma-B regulation protein RsbU (phosphoserine phosphatase)
MRDSFVSYESNVAAMAAPLRHAGKDLGVLIVAREHKHGLFTDHDFSVFRSIAEQSSFALGNSMIHIEAHEKRALENELRNAREVQRILLPQSNPNIPGYAIAGINISARLISGDYYDFINLGNHRWGIVIADVSGKGVPAGLLMSMCRSLVRAYAFDETSPTKVLAHVNRQMFPDIREDMFITLTYMILDEASGKLTMSRAGHDAALLFQRETGQITQLRSPGLAIGIDEGPVFERKTVDMEIFLKPGDCLLLHTDGLKEAVNSDDDDYGMDRLKECFLQGATKGAASILTDMQNSHKDFTGSARQKDDITLVVLEKL